MARILRQVLLFYLDLTGWRWSARVSAWLDKLDAEIEGKF